ncbi:hypothetical protein EXE46_11765 [Halorubrum sp. GN11_10-6_MGM]|uniref:hypothetical protein n=1 Tax=Halorubrum sp. GN11_10-6_MGM TaxID=2518112 RepID=UPI0010F712C9|nr:hypothetical protein [Halorubrum sp. GN11_10-6_MGM]TKX73919.1 hypothetical protein EXE46_11765 [Halorubrum sp. GN11_10-6_MGM]
MPLRNRPFAIAGGAALLSCIGLGYAWYTLSGIPAEPRGDGFVAGIVAAIGLGIGLTGLFALAEATTLAAVVRFGSPTRLARAFLSAGAVVGSVGTVLPLFIELARLPSSGSPLTTLADRMLPFAFGGWLLLAAIGMLCSILGVVFHLFDRIQENLGSTAA